MDIQVFTRGGRGDVRPAGTIEATRGALTIGPETATVHDDSVGRELLGILRREYGEWSHPFGLIVDGERLHNCSIIKIALPAYMEIVHGQFADQHR